jgi:hypothetical protein
VDSITLYEYRNSVFRTVGASEITANLSPEVKNTQKRIHAIEITTLYYVDAELLIITYIEIMVASPPASSPLPPSSRRRDKPQLSCNLCRRRK